MRLLLPRAVYPWTTAMEGTGKGVRTWAAVSAIRRPRPDPEKPGKRNVLQHVIALKWGMPESLAFSGLPDTEGDLVIRGGLGISDRICTKCYSDTLVGKKGAGIRASEADS
ncbi:hypothetical protein NDU88_009447 [Pleurodeles waltl]|uniref:Uncharacterized protein n=1 Tax=Pleurodeles waltl TaxID=8319 RepID=A0AAV7PVZ3_PLEWA|nr:hypothetical protein NDU88_009447 [Pleurodeles waltl]